MHTVALNLTQKISAISRPLRSSLPPERSLRSAHHLSAELHSKTDVCGRTESSAPTNRIRKMMPDRHHQDSVRRGVRRSQLHSASAEAAKAPYPLAPSSFPNCDRCAGSQFGVIWCGQMHRETELLHDGGTGWSPGFESSLSFLHRARRFFSFSIKRKKRMGAQSGRTGSSAPTQ